MSMKKKIYELIEMKRNEKIAVLTCYDYSFAKAMDGQVDVLLVGDSLGNVIYGYDRTKEVTMDDLIKHVSAVKKGANNTFIIADMPYGSYENKKEALNNAQKLILAGADAVKPEGEPEIIEFLVKNNVNVVGHVGLLPQTASKLGVVGRDENESENIFSLSKNIEKAGAFMIVLESIPLTLSLKITEELKIPTIGIGAGNVCDGQVLVLYDLLGLYPNFEPKFVRKYLNLKEDVKKAVSAYTSDVKKGKFPSKKESFE